MTSADQEDGNALTSAIKVDKISIISQCTASRAYIARLVPFLKRYSRNFFCVPIDLDVITTIMIISNRIGVLTDEGNRESCS